MPIIDFRTGYEKGYVDQFYGDNDHWDDEHYDNIDNRWSSFMVIMAMRIMMT